MPLGARAAGGRGGRGDADPGGDEGKQSLRRGAAPVDAGPLSGRRVVLSLGEALELPLMHGG